MKNLLTSKTPFCQRRNLLLGLYGLLIVMLFSSLVSGAEAKKTDELVGKPMPLI